MQLETRFANDSRPIHAILSLVPSVLTGLDDAACSSLVEDLHFWDKDLPSPDSLKASLTLYKYIVLKTYLQPTEFIWKP